MFENVPEALERKVGDLKLKFPPDSDLRYSLAAFHIGEHYINLRFKDKSTFEFLLLPSLKKQEPSFVMHTKIMNVGESLFLLRNSAGFDAYCIEARARKDFRSVYFEISSTRTFLNNGYNIQLVERSGTRKEDFDFAACKDGNYINAEVTALTAEDFNERTVINALLAKRGQLPNTLPAAIFCIVPDRWMYPVELIHKRFEKLGSEFLKSTRRINAVFFMAQMPMTWVPDGSRGVNPIGVLPYFNPNPRFPFPDRDFIGGINITPEIRRAINGIGFPGALKILRENDFYRWVDSLTK